MALFRTDLVQRDAKLDRWAELYFHLEHPWLSEPLAFCLAFLTLRPHPSQLR